MTEEDDETTEKSEVEDGDFTKFNDLDKRVAGARISMLASAMPGLPFSIEVQVVATPEN